MVSDERLAELIANAAGAVDESWWLDDVADALTELQSLRSQAGVSEAVAWISVCKEGPYQGDAEVQTVEPIRPPFNSQWGDWQPLYAHPAPIEITEDKTPPAINAALVKKWIALTHEISVGPEPDEALEILHRSLTAALQGETK